MNEPDTLQDLFETWIKTNIPYMACYLPRKTKQGDYHSFLLQDFWDCWLTARRAQT